MLLESESLLAQNPEALASQTNSSNNQSLGQVRVKCLMMHGIRLFVILTVLQSRKYTVEMDCALSIRQQGHQQQPNDASNNAQCQQCGPKRMLWSDWLRRCRKLLGMQLPQSFLFLQCMCQTESGHI